MVKCVIDADNFEQIIAEIKDSSDAVFDFSGTNFTELGGKKPSAVSEIFNALALVQRTFFLKLNLCNVDDKNEQQLEHLTQGLSQTKKMVGFEFIRSLSAECPETILERIVNSLLENDGLRSVKIDGFRVTPPHICKTLTSHPTILVVVINGLPQKVQSMPEAANSTFFQPISKPMVSELSQAADIKPKNNIKSQR